MKGTSVDEYLVKSNNSWIMNSILRCREVVANSKTWRDLQNGDKFPTALLYKELRLNREKVRWRKLLFKNRARPRALFILWMVCWSRLYTNDRLIRFGLNVQAMCYLCSEAESCDHLFFECEGTKGIWSRVLNWLNIDHRPDRWLCEMEWVLKIAKGKSVMGMILKVAIAESIYQAWRLRNFKKNDKVLKCEDAAKEVIASIVSRCEDVPRLREFIRQDAGRILGG